MTTPKTALIETLTDDERVRAHLSGQPAVPLSDDLGTALVQVAEAEHAEHNRAAAERRVLDSMRDANKFSLLELANTLIGAELARREGK